MKNEAARNQEAGHAALVHPEGHVSGGGGRPRTSGRPPRRHRLKRSVEVFPASDGSIHLIQEGLGRHFLVEAPRPEDRMVLDLLQQGPVSVGQLKEELLDRGLDPADVETSLNELAEIALLETQTEKSGDLVPERAERFDRQLIYLADLGSGETGEELQTKLADATVTILGCGGLGCWTASGLACAGIGHLRLIDDDTIDLSNLNRQLLFGELDIGRLKVEVAADALKRNDPSIDIACHPLRVNSSHQIEKLISGSDLLVATADWPPHELAHGVNRAALETGVPYISAGQFPPTVRIGPLVVPGETPCLECQESAFKNDYPLYDELARFRATAETTASTLGAASGLIGSMISMEVIHFLTGAVRPATMARALIMDLRTMVMEHEAIHRDPACSCSASVRKT